MEKILIILFIAIVYTHAGFAVKSYREIRNEGVVRQNYEESCGAAAVATLLNLLDMHQFSESDIVSKMSSNTNMVSFLELSKVLHDLGWENKGYQISREVFEKLNIPVLVKIQNDPRYPHFVVVINQIGDFISVFDPNFGKYISSKDEFYSIWDKDNLGGYVLIVNPKNKFMPSHKLNLPTNKSIFDK